MFIAALFITVKTWKQTRCPSVSEWIHCHAFRRWNVIQCRKEMSYTEVENKRMDTKGEGGGGMNWEIGIDIYTLLILCIK